jgi:putative MATE family efflux protein
VNEIISRRGPSAAARDIRRDVARLAVPVIGQSLLQTLVFLVDRAMLGRFSSDALASLQISGPIVWSLAAMVGAIQVGAIAVVGREAGAKRPSEAAAGVRAGLFAALVLGVIAGGLGVLSMPLLHAAFPNAGPNVHAAAREYLTTMLPAMPLLLIAAMAAAVHQAAGDTRTPLFVAIGANIVNAGVNWVLVFGHLGAPALGARGAAIGGVLAFSFECAVLGTLLWRGRGVISMRGRGGERKGLARMTKVALPVMLERTLQYIGYLSFTAMIGALGTVAMAANQALIGIESIAFLSADGFGIAAASIVAQRLGAGQPAEARLGARVAVMMGTAALTACGLVFLLLPQPLASAFSSDRAIVEAVVPCLAVMAFAQPFMASSVVLGEAFRGAGAVRATLIVTMLGGFVVRLVATYVLAFRFELGLVGVWLGSTIDWVVRTACFVWIFARGKWTQTVV